MVSLITGSGIHHCNPSQPRRRTVTASQPVTDAALPMFSKALSEEPRPVIGDSNRSMSNTAPPPGFPPDPVRRCRGRRHSRCVVSRCPVVVTLAGCDRCQRSRRPHPRRSSALSRSPMPSRKCVPPTPKSTMRWTSMRHEEAVTIQRSTRCCGKHEADLRRRRCTPPDNNRR